MADVEDLVGTIVNAERDDEGDGIVLTYSDGRRVELIGIGYDGLWQHVIVVESDSRG